MSKRVITVFGATGAQGGGLARAILADPKREFAVRAVTRKPDSLNARALAGAGAEIVVADIDDVPSVERAMKGAYGAFCVTNFWEHFSADKEYVQATNLAEGARRAEVGARHLVDARGHSRSASGRWEAHARARGSLQRAALRCQGRGEQRIHWSRSAGDTSLYLVLLGQLHPLRHGAEARAGW